MYTYVATNTSNGRFYIGSTKNFERRKKSHLKSRVNLPFQNALRKNPEAFEWEVWEDDSDLPVMEQALLDMWFHTAQCYNLSSIAGRPGPEVCTRAGKASALSKHAEKNEEGKSIAAVKMGKAGGERCKTDKLGAMGYSFEERSQISKKTHIKYPDLASRMGKKSAVRKKLEKSKKVRCVETGFEYPSISEASRQTGVNVGSISRCCRKPHKTASGFHWEFSGECK
jgi:group I intron endonuclease